jgi:hypothetical protein
VGRVTGIICSHFAIYKEGRLMEFKLKVKPLTTADFLLTSLDFGNTK